jgi:hypothetical protein
MFAEIVDKGLMNKYHKYLGLKAGIEEVFTNPSDPVAQFAKRALEQGQG